MRIGPVCVSNVCRHETEVNSPRIDIHGEAPGPISTSEMNMKKVYMTPVLRRVPQAETCPCFEGFLETIVSRQKSD
jgi:hypothetical protein